LESCPYLGRIIYCNLNLFLKNNENKKGSKVIYNLVNRTEIQRNIETDNIHELQDLKKVTSVIYMDSVGEN